MDCPNYNTEEPERKSGQHLQREDRGAIQQLHRLGYSNRAIARELHCSPTTVGNELRRGTPPRKSKRGRAPGYSAKLGQATYCANRGRCHPAHKVASCTPFVSWVAQQVREHHWSLDACVGYASVQRLFPKAEMVCTKTLYNELWAGNLPLSLFEVPDALKRRRTKGKNHINKRPKGRSIEERPAEVADRVVPGHWEADTVVGLRKGKEAVVLTLVERVTNHYIAIRISDKSSPAVQAAMLGLRAEFGAQFGSVFKTITTDNGSEFEHFSEVEQWGTKVFFAHPYSSWERPVNERHNGMLRAFLPKGTSMEKYSAEQVLAFADEMNSHPRKRLVYRTPEELFDIFLDRIYAA